MLKIKKMVRIFNSRTNEVKSDSKVTNAKTQEDSWVHELFNSSLVECKSLLLICASSQVIEEGYDHGDNRLIGIVKSIVSLGYEIHCIVKEEKKDEGRCASILCRAGAKKVLSACHNEAVKRHIEEIAVKNKIFFSVVIIDFYKTYCEFYESVKYTLPNVKIIVDSIDVCWLRTTEDNQEAVDKEVFAYSNANVVFADNESKRSEIIKKCPGANVKILPNTWSIKSDSINPITKVKEIIFVDHGKGASDGSAQRAIKIFNKFIQRYPCFSSSILHIVTTEDGINMPSVSQENIRVYNHAPQGLLKELYECCYVALLPFTCETEVVRSICEAISNKIPVITTSMGAYGLNLVDEVDVLVANDIEKQVHSIYKVFTADAELYVRMTNSAASKLCAMTGAKARNSVLTCTLSAKPITVSIVTYNNGYLLQRCLESILSNTKYPDYKIHVTSNACKDNTRQIMQLYTSKYKNITYQYNEENKYFIKAHNEAINLFPKDDIILLNEDVEIVSSCWISDLYSAAYSAAHVGCVGGKTLYPDGTICEAGAYLLNDGGGRNIGRYQDQKTSAYNIARYVGYVSGCLMYMRRDCIDKFGPLDMYYYPCYYEDSDWQYNLHLNGYKTVYTPKVVAVHREGSSCGTNPDDENSFKRFIKINKTKFAKRYESVNIESYNS